MLFDLKVDGPTALSNVRLAAFSWDTVYAGCFQPPVKDELGLKTPGIRSIVMA
jgi:hypothetical protein